jgi:hypothetical protein
MISQDPDYRYHLAATRDALNGFKHIVRAMHQLPNPSLPQAWMLLDSESTSARAE